MLLHCSVVKTSQQGVGGWVGGWGWREGLFWMVAILSFPWNITPSISDSCLWSFLAAFLCFRWVLVEPFCCYIHPSLCWTFSVQAWKIHIKPPHNADNMYTDTSTFTHTDSSRTLFYSLWPSSSPLMNEWGIFLVIFCLLHCIMPVADSYKYEQIMLQTLHTHI